MYSTINIFFYFIITTYIIKTKKSILSFHNYISAYYFYIQSFHSTRHQVPKKCPTSPPTILPVFMRLRRLFIPFLLKSHFSHSQTTTPVCPLVHYGKKRRERYFNHSLCNEPTGVRTRDT